MVPMEAENATFEKLSTKVHDLGGDALSKVETRGPSTGRRSEGNFYAFDKAKNNDFQPSSTFAKIPSSRELFLRRSPRTDADEGIKRGARRADRKQRKRRTSRTIEVSRDDTAS